MEARITMLSDYVREQQRWRESKAGEFPDDKRNGESAAALESLAEFVERLEDEGSAGEDWALLERLEPHMFGDGATLGGEMAARETSRYGFGHGVTDGTHTEFLTDLWIACMEDAYEYRGEHDEDPTGELSRVESGAALFGLALPPNYWRRRSRAFEDELESEIDELMQAAIASNR
jgi:hypothetical protein